MVFAVEGVDLSKSVYQLSLAGAKHHAVDRKRLSRVMYHRFLAQTVPVRLVMEACGTSHSWGRTAQSHGRKSSCRFAPIIDPIRSNICMAC